MISASGEPIDPKGALLRFTSTRGRVLALLTMVALCFCLGAGGAAANSTPCHRRDHGLRRIVDDLRAAGDRPEQHLLLREHRHALDPDRQRRARRCPDGCKHDHLCGRLRLRPGREARQLHPQHARGGGAEVEPGRDQLDLRPDQAGRDGRRGRLDGPGRELHGAGAEPDGPQQRGAGERGQPGDLRRQRGRQGRARTGRRRFRLPLRLRDQSDPADA